MTDSPSPHQTDNPFAFAHYRRFVAGAFAATNALWIQRLMLGFYAWDVTNSVFWTTAVGAGLFLPSALFGPVFGVFVDRRPLRRSINIAILISLLGYLSIGLIYLSASTNPILITLCSALVGLGTGLYSPARLVMPSVLVPKPAIPTAVAVSGISFNTTRVIGPFLGALGLSTIGLLPTFTIAFLLYATFWPVSLSLDLSARNTRSASQVGKTTVWADLIAGLKYAWKQPNLRSALIFAVASSWIVRSISELSPALNGLWFEGGEYTLSLLTLAPAIGAIIAGVLLGLMKGNLPLLRQSLVISILIGVGSVGIIAVYPTLPVVFAALLVNGLVGSIAASGSQTFLQLNTDDEFRARVLSVWASLALGSIAVAAAVYSAIAELWGMTPTLLGLCAVGMAIAIWLSLSKLRAQL